MKKNTPSDTVNKTTTIEHRRSTRGTPLSIYHIASLALDLSKRTDGTIDPEQLEENFEKAFRLLTKFDKLLADLQD